ncbi:hypothetical protein C4544_07415 [candidate division WS5 bacterium]|uniref:Uncharacterized protein n=1 Tax=candidate division WS5 bacterium TaxID=2093353 RepID=A0A419D9X7_9BACT|nr:MAG: hypothetical protein C4544_07415 [candidate division WS5 bacterium]
MIETPENKRITGWHEIAKAWGLSVRESERSASIKYAKRFFNKIEITIYSDTGEIICTKPIQKCARYVYTYQNILCTLKANYIFGKSDIANYLGIGVVQFSRNLKRYGGLKRIIMNPCGQFFYANKRALDDWTANLNNSRIKNNKRKLREYMKSQNYILRENLKADEERNQESLKAIDKILHKYHSKEPTTV